MTTTSSNRYSYIFRKRIKIIEIEPFTFLIGYELQCEKDDGNTARLLCNDLATVYALGSDKVRLEVSRIVYIHPFM